MRHLFKSILLATLLTLAFTSIAFSAPMIWVKGNLHTHTSNSDGDTSPQSVVDWYKSHGYQFLAITDHAKLTLLDGYTKGEFVLIPGEEILASGDKLPTHANAFGMTQPIPYPKKEKTTGATAHTLISTIRSQSGLPMLNHPFFYWFYGYPELMHENGPFLIEVYNGNYDSKKWGTALMGTGEQMWDALLSNGLEVYATATDDSHHYKKIDNTPGNPGRGWIYAHVPTLTSDAVLNALRKGDFYASTGVELSEYGFDGKEFRVSVVPRAGQNPRIIFIGKNGTILNETKGNTAAYRVSETADPNAYIRCKVVAEDGKTVWTQAYRLNK